MRKHATDVYLAAVKVNGRDQAVLVAADIEYDKITDFVGRRKRTAQGGKVVKFGLPHNLKPARQRLLAGGMLLPEQAQGFARDHMHSN